MASLAQLLKPQSTEHWGSVYNFKPELLRKIFGDGGRLVKVFPIMERPHYWIVRVDSRCTDLLDDDGDLLDEIYEAIDEQFGTPSEDDLGVGDERPYYPMHDGQGVCWEFVSERNLR